MRDTTFCVHTPILFPEEASPPAHSAGLACLATRINSAWGFRSEKKLCCGLHVLSLPRPPFLHGAGEGGVPPVGGREKQRGILCLHSEAGRDVAQKGSPLEGYILSGFPKKPPAVETGLSNEVQTQDENQRLQQNLEALPLYFGPPWLPILFITCVTEGRGTRTKVCHWERLEERDSDRIH